MTVYLVEDEVGYDTDSVGFPNLGGCLAVVLMTEHWLYGFHITPGNTRKIREFLDFVLSYGPRGEYLQLYGTCNRANRYPVQPKQQWQQEMGEIANALNYHGKISGYDLSSWAAKITATEATYVEYRRIAGERKCSIHFKRMSKMDCTTGTMQPGVMIRKIVPDRAMPGSYKLAVPYNNRVTIGAQVIDTADNGGQLHTVSFLGLESFERP
ncbi:MAG TPA: hypothetical protein VM689_12570 [Aliidongia sp.]|nr:hypothetical protein [Aliidongia sp.]